MKEWFQETLFNWIYTLLYGLLEGLLRLVKLVESFFDIFAGTAKVSYQGDYDFLINIFFRNSAITNAFWGMTLIALTLAFIFCIYNVIRKVTDVTGTAKHTIGQIMSNFFRCLLTLLLLNAILVAGLNISNVLLDRINYTMLNAGILDQDTEEREFTEAEFATMARVLATVGNYSVNPSYNSRYNINSCFNEIRGDLYSLQSAGVFDFAYDTEKQGHCWQSALALLASSADLTTELSLDDYDAEVSEAYETVVYQLNYNPRFKPVESVSGVDGVSPDKIKTDVLIFLSASVEAANNDVYNTGDIYDTIRIGYFNGEKDYTDLDQVRKDFDLSEMDYLVGYVVSIVFILLMAICIFNLIVRIFNLLLLYVSAPMFVSSMPLDEGAKFQNWIQAFVIQMFSGFGMVVAMRLYLLMIPVIMSSDLIFFTGSGMWYSFLNLMARLFMILGGAWAVLKSSSVISGILAGNPGMAALQQEGQTSAVITGGAKLALQDTVKLVKSIPKLPSALQKVATAPARAVNAMSDYKHGFTDPYHAIGDKRRARKQQKSERAAAKSKEKNVSKQVQQETAGQLAALAERSSERSGSARDPIVPDYPAPPPLPPRNDRDTGSTGS